MDDIYVKWSVILAEGLTLEKSPSKSLTLVIGPLPARLIKPNFQITWGLDILIHFITEKPLCRR